jgi:hypothetical protein
MRGSLALGSTGWFMVQWPTLGKLPTRGAQDANHVTELLATERITQTGAVALRCNVQTPPRSGSGVGITWPLRRRAAGVFLATPPGRAFVEDPATATAVAQIRENLAGLEERMASRRSRLPHQPLCRIDFGACERARRMSKISSSRVLGTVLFHERARPEAAPLWFLSRAHCSLRSVNSPAHTNG